MIALLTDWRFLLGVVVGGSPLVTLLLVLAWRKPKDSGKETIALLKTGNKLRAEQVSALCYISGNLREQCDSAAEIVKLNQELLKLAKERTAQ